MIFIEQFRARWPWSIGVLESWLSMSSSSSEVPAKVKLRKGRKMICDVGEVTESLENELCSTVYSSAHSPTFPSFHLRHSSFSNPSVALPTSQLIFQPFRSFTYVIAHSPTLLPLLLRHRLFTYFTWRAAHAYRAEARNSWSVVDVSFTLLDRWKGIDACPVM